MKLRRCSILCLHQIGRWLLFLTLFCQACLSLEFLSLEVFHRSGQILKIVGSILRAVIMVVRKGFLLASKGSEIAGLVEMNYHLRGGCCFHCFLLFNDFKFRGFFIIHKL